MSAALSKAKIIAHAYEITKEAKVMNPTTGREHTNIHMWCLDRDSKPCLIRIDDFPMSFTVELPEMVGDIPIDWNGASIEAFLDVLSYRCGDKSPLSYDFIMASKIYYDQGDRKSPMIRLYFANLEHMWACSSLLQYPIKVSKLVPVPIQFTVCEANIDAVRKMMTATDCQFAQWFEIEGIEIPPGSEYRIQVPGPDDRPLRELVATWESLKPIPHNLTATWSAKPRVMAFDIETYSNNHKAMPSAFNPLHSTIIITCVLQVKGDKSSRQKFAFVYGDCPDIPDATIINVANEDMLLEEMAALVRRYCPEILIGYNIIGFDYAYLDTRLKTRLKPWPEMGRIKGRRPVMMVKEWYSAAYGHNKLSILQADGIISIDMLPLIKRDYKLPKYDLDSVSKHFIGRGKHDVKISAMFVAHEHMMFARKQVDKTVKMAVEAVPELAPPRSMKSYSEHIEERLALLESFTEDGRLPEKICSRAKLTLKRFSMAQEQLRKFVAYGLEDATLCIDLFDKLNIWEGLIQLSNVVGVTIMELFTRGQQVRCLSQLYHTAHKMGFVLNKRFASKLFFNGGFVFDPVVGLHNNIICLDFASLYPSIMQAYNICFSTLVPPERAARVKDSTVNIIKFEQDEPVDGKPKKRGGMPDEDNDMAIGDPVEEDDEDEEKAATVKRAYEYKWVKREVREGVLPRIVRELVAERNQVKGQIKEVEKKNDPLENVLPFLNRAIRDGTTLSALIESIRDELKTLEAEFATLAAGTAKSAMEMGLSSLKGAIATLTGFGDITTVECLERVSKQVEEYKMQLVVLDKRQNALKVSANSMFGFLGAQDGGVMPLIEGAMSITAIGRILINMVNDYLKDKYDARIIYNDTDSVMVDLGIEDSKEAYARGVALSIEISGKPAKKDKDGKILEPAVPGLFPPPLKMEFEKAMKLLCIKKKKYAALLIDKDGSYVTDKKTGKLNILKRGIVLARRDNCGLIRETYQKLLEAVLEGKSISNGFSIIMDCCCRLLSGKVPPRGNLTIIRELGSAYKQDNYFMKLFSEELRRMGRPPNPGDRLEYVIALTDAELRGEKVKLGLKMRDISMYEEAIELETARIEGRAVVAKAADPELIFEDEPLDPLRTPESESASYPPEQIDYVYYVEHMLMAPLDQLFSIGYSKQLEELSDVMFSPVYTRLHPCSISTPIKMLTKMITDYTRGGIPLEEVTEGLHSLPEWFDEILASRGL